MGPGTVQETKDSLKALFSDGSLAVVRDRVACSSVVGDDVVVSDTVEKPRTEDKGEEELRIAAPFVGNGFDVCIAQDCIDDLDDWIGRLHCLKRRKAVPPWSLPAEIWQSLLSKTETMSSTCCSVRKCWHTLLHLIRRTDRTPWIWQVSKSCPISKNNNKSGCRGQRLIHKLDAAGKSFYGSIWRRHRQDRSNWYEAFGFLAHRRRESAIFIQQQVRARLLQHGFGCLTQFYDVRNAFPSPEHSALDEMVDVIIKPQDRALVKQRYKEAVVVVEGGDENENQVSLALHPRVGNLQGDTVSPDQFLALYVPILCTWKHELAANEDAFVPVMTLDVDISEQFPADAPLIDVCVTSMADDVASTHFALNYGQASETLRISQSTLGKGLESVGMSLAADKGGVLCCFRGFASDVATMLLSSPGKLRNDRYVCYLGCCLQSDGQSGSEVTRRKEKMVSAWWKLKGFWSSRVPSEVKAIVFRATVLQAATANAMMFRYTQQQQLSIGGLYNRFLRKLLG
jgi:hypothetical protein